MKRLRAHKHNSPLCFADVPDQTFPSLAKTLKQEMTVNNDLFVAAKMGDADHFFMRTDPDSAHMCSGCSSLYRTKALAKKHTRNSGKCQGKKVCPVQCRETIFGTLVRVPASKKQRLPESWSPVPVISPAAACQVIEDGSECPSLATCGSSSVSNEAAPPPSRPSAPERLRAAIAAGFVPRPVTQRQIGQDKIKPFLEPGDDPFDYAPLYKYLGRPHDVEARLRSIRQYTTTNSTYEHEVIIEAACQTVDDDLRYKVECIWPNLRAILQSVGPQEDADEKLDHGTFTYRQTTASLRAIAAPLVLFLWNNPDWHWEEAEAVMAIATEAYPNNKADAAALVVQSGVLCDAFLSLLVEEPAEVCDSSLVTEFAVSQCFRYIKGDDTFRLCRPDTCARTLASLHHLLRAGVCSVVCGSVFRNNVTQGTRDLMMTVKVAKPNSELCGIVRSMKERFERSTIKNPPSTFNLRGDLCVGNEIFRKEIIDNLIPKVLDVAKRAIGGICGGNEGWKKVLDPKNTIEVNRPDPSKFEFSIVSPKGEKTHWPDLIDRVQITDHNVMEHADLLIGCCYAALQGFGCGAPRGTEYSTIKRNDLVNSGGKLFYDTLSKKVKSKHVKTGHCLPPCVSRVLFLALCILPPGDNLALFDKDPTSILGLVATVWGIVFQIPRPVPTSVMRQLFAAVANSMNRANPLLNFKNPGKVSDGRNVYGTMPLPCTGYFLLLCFCLFTPLRFSSSSSHFY